VPRSPAIRIAAIVAAVLLVIIGWYLGSPLFIRTTTFEDFPTPTTTTFPHPTSAPGASTAEITGVSGFIPTVVARGDLQRVDALHSGAGQVLLIRAGDQRVLRFENVAITNAPDVHVYLSRETGGKWSESTSLYLGALKATDGSFNYDLPAGADIAPFKSVVVWCRAFAVLVTWADLRVA
jgi:hypothetical protein